MSETKHKTILLSEYTPPPFLVDFIDLTFQLGEKETVVYARSAFRKNPVSDTDDNNLFLYGEDIELLDIFIDGEKLQSDGYEVERQGLHVWNVPSAFSLEIITRFSPEDNTALSGLYISSGNFCTQCEAEGFRRITYYPDRPDVLARFKTRIEAHSAKFPVLLSNGNLVDHGNLEHGYHYAVWEDPYPKPSYLFALVAGNLVSVKDRYTTKSGKEISLEIYVQQRNRDKCQHALQSLIKAMKWDEDVFGLEYDLDRYLIVAVDDFNMGAMENKGLNVFNSKYVLASPETATDQDYLGIEGVIAHEYFHNWTGNRVTCRDWFQLSLKEGLTVFRDQEFSSDMNSRPVQRIEDVRILRQFQFREDASPMAHPVRPESYVEINNFYTVTVYNKGAEVVRMIHTIIGRENFRKGMDLYFQRHDGQAVTCEDFVSAMSNASSIDLTQFQQWYAQAGTPLLNVMEIWDDKQGKYKLKISQSTEATPGPGQDTKEPFHIPILVGLLDEKGNDIDGIVSADCRKSKNSFLLELKEDTQTFVFQGLSKRPVLSFLRQFSAPVRVDGFHTREELAFLMGNDTDLFNRWDAAFSLSESIIKENTELISHGKQPDLDQTFTEAFRKNLNENHVDRSLAAMALTLPTEAYMAQILKPVDPESLHRGYMFVVKNLSEILEKAFLRTYEENNDSTEYILNPEGIGKRSLKNICLFYLLSAEKPDEKARTLCVEQFRNSTNMTDTIAALAAVSHLKIPERDEMMDHFERKWIDEPLVMDKWFTIQASSRADDTFARVQKLMSHPVFSIKNPNKVRSLIGAFSANHHQFHNKDGSGYTFLADMILKIDSKNQQIAARLVNPLISYKRYEPVRRQLMKEQLERIIRQNISRDVHEIVQKSLT